MKLKIFSLIFLVELLDTGSQVLFKKSAGRLDPNKIPGLKGVPLFLGDILKMPSIWCGFLLVSCGLLLWFTVLAEADLSLAFPLGGMRYLLIMAASNLFLGEKISYKRSLGALCITFGIVCIGLS